MSETLNKKNIKFFSRQNRCLPILLWFLPLIILDIGWIFIKLIDYRWKNIDQIEQAKQKVEKLAASSDFSYSFGRLAGDYLQIIKSGSLTYSQSNQKEVFKKYLEDRDKYIFRNPFPDHELFVFQIINNKKPEILYTNQNKIKGKRALELCFEYLVRVNSFDDTYSENDKKSASEIMKSIFGGENEPDIIAETQRGKPSYSLYKQKPNRFIWDYIKNPKTGNIYGFFLITDNNFKLEINGKLLALREFNKTFYSNDERGFTAFIPIFPGYGGIISDEKFAKMPEYKILSKKFVPRDINAFYKWHTNGVPSGKEETKIGDYQAFFHIISGQSHCAVLLLPQIEKMRIPYWLSITNIVFSFYIIILLIRGSILGIWPQTTLKVRFFTTYFLSSCIPLGLLIIVTYCYVYEFYHSTLFSYQSKLNFLINQFDIRQAKSQDEYRTTFINLKNDEGIINSFKNLYLANKKEPDVFLPEAKEALNRSLGLFDNNSKKLPILSFTIIDERGACFTQLGDSDCQYYRYKTSKKTKILEEKKENTNEEKEENTKEKRIRAFTDNSIDTILYSIVQPLRNRIASGAHNWDEELVPSLEQSMAAGGFKIARGNAGNLSEEFDRRRSVIVTRPNGNRTVSYIYDFINIEGVPRFVIFLYWDVGSLDETNIDSLIRYFDIEEPNYVFSTIKATSQGIEEPHTSRHWAAYKVDKDLANQAFISKAAVTSNVGNKTVMAVPSKKYADTIIMGAVSHHHVLLPIFYRILICVSIIALSLIIFIICINTSSNLFLNPITNLKKSLDRVADGEFDIEIKSNRKDEFGTMCHEFSNMTHELSERDKLATLISDHAVEALSRNSENNDSSTVESFIGTALVTDIRNFTGMCESHTPDLITNLLNEHFAVMTRIIAQNGGRIYKYIGDAIVAIFANRDNTEKTSTERAFLTSIEMIEGLKEINNKRKTNGLFEYKIGIGLSYGKMISDSIGSIETRLDYAILGNALDNAEILENSSKKNPELPIVFSKEFVAAFNILFADIEFLRLTNDKEKESYIIDETNKDKYLKGINKKIDNKLITENIEKSESSKNLSNKQNKIIKIEDNYSLNYIFIICFIYIMFLVTLISCGFYFYLSTSLNNKKTILSNDNQRVFEQIISDDHNDNGKVVFDAKCREIAKKINDKFKELEGKDISDEYIRSVLDDNSNKESGLSKIFIKVDDYSNIINASDTKFCDKIPLRAVFNKGFSKIEEEKICNSYRIFITLNELDKLTSKFESEEKKQSFQLPFKRHMEGKYGEPSREIFGDNVLIALFKDFLNSSIEISRDKENCLMYSLDFYNNNESEHKLIGYLILSMPTNQIANSTSLFLNAYSQDGSLIALKDSDTNWLFSNNVPDNLKNAIIKNSFTQKALESVNKDINKEFIEKNITDIIKSGNINIGNRKYDFYLFRFYGYDSIDIIKAFSFVFFTLVLLIHYLIKITKGNSKVNTSISAKLWLNLIVVSIIPVFTMFFVFYLFINEFYSVQVFQKRNEIQKFNDSFEQKADFTSPLAWNNIRKKNASKDLINHINKLNNKNQTDDYYNSIFKDLRNLTQSWVEEPKKYTAKEKSIVNYYVADMSISGKNGWTYCLSDKVDSYKEKELDMSKYTDNSKELLESVSYIEANTNISKESFGIMLKQFAKSILYKRGNTSQGSGPIDKGKMINEMAMETIFKTIRTFFGDDTLVMFSHAIDVPIVLDIGFGKLGIFITPVPNYEKPEGILMWMIMFDTHSYLLNQADEINNDYNVYSSKSYCYGNVAEKSYDNDLRISLGKYSAWLSTSNLPISTIINNKNSYSILEGIPSKYQYDSFILYTYSIDLIQKYINYLIAIFYLFLIVSVITIIITIRDIANDLINPINDLIMGIKEVNHENFSYRIDSDRKDELGSLCLSFDKMIKGLDEKRTMSHMLSKTAQLFTLQESRVNSAKVDSVLLYVGVPDFSQYMNKLSDKEIFANLKKQTSIIAGIIMEEGGEVDKIIGQKLLSIFPIKQNDSQKALLSACLAAKRIQQQENMGNLPFPVAIGLNYGNVISGFLGVGNKRDFTIIGDPVNVTARIESLAEKLENSRCLISKTIYDQIKDFIKAELYGEVELKGKSEPMKVYLLT